MYAISASLTRTTANGNVTQQIPMFYLDENVQGILSVHQAKQIAQSILDPFGDHGTRLYVYAQEV